MEWRHAHNLCRMVRSVRNKVCRSQRVKLFDIERNVVATNLVWIGRASRKFQGFCFLNGFLYIFGFSWSRS